MVGVEVGGDSKCILSEVPFGEINGLSLSEYSSANQPKRPFHSFVGRRAKTG